MSITNLEPAIELSPPVVDIVNEPEKAESPTTQSTARKATPTPDLPVAENMASIVESEPSQEESSSRPSRRARGAVSYAEPSLNSKMRRSNKGMVDAVYKSSSDRTSGQHEVKVEDGDESSKARRRSSLNRTSTGSRRSRSLHGSGLENAGAETGSSRPERASTDDTAAEATSGVETDVVQRVAKVKGQTSPAAESETEQHPAQASPSAREGRRSVSACIGPATASEDGKVAAEPVVGVTSRRRSMVM